MPSYKVKLEICGSSYIVSTNDSADYLQGLADRLDGDIQKVMQTSSNSSVVSAAIITALGYLDEETKTRQAADNMRGQIQDYLEDAAKAKLAAEEARREVERLRRELSYYEKKNKQDAASGTRERQSEEPKEGMQQGGGVNIQPAAPQQEEPHRAPPPTYTMPQAASLPKTDSVASEPKPQQAEMEGQLGLEDL